ncbi:MAG: TraB/GumN family protein [Gammaproteobacteria bacterium]|nr:TraB/GumN family protein [Gammaproteobacteria bacterium]MDH3468430.1 TraB/GumN family protein [Gammaproteobacteria bacterium]
MQIYTVMRAAGLVVLFHWLGFPGAAAQAESSSADLTYPPPGQQTPIIRSDRGESNSGVLLNSREAQRRAEQRRSGHTLIDGRYRLRRGSESQSATPAASVPAPSQAATTTIATPVPVAITTPEVGLLWRVQRDGGPHSYVFGTIHVDDPRVLDLPKTVLDAFQTSPVFVPEASLEEANILAIGFDLILKDGRTLEGIVGPELFEKVVARLASIGVPRQATNLLKPWAALIMLSAPKSPSGMFLDRKLFLDAKRLGKSIQPLETMDEQLGIFKNMPESNQITMLGEAVDQHAELPQMVEHLLGAYLNRDLSELQSISREYQTGQSDIADEMMERIVDKRNVTMVERLVSTLELGGAFVAIGALHLPGDGGVLQMLRSEGFDVTAEY